VLTRDPRGCLHKYEHSMTDLLLYPLLSTRSRRALLKTRKRGRKIYDYAPRGTLLQRLSQETGMSIEEVYQQLYKERVYLRKKLGVSGE